MKRYDVQRAWSAAADGGGGVPVKISDRKRWERELTAHMRRHAADLQVAPRQRPQPGVWMTAPRLILWTLMVVVITSAGWAIGLYIF